MLFSGHFVHLFNLHTVMQAIFAVVIELYHYKKKTFLLSFNSYMNWGDCTIVADTLMAAGIFNSCVFESFHTTPATQH